MSKYLYFISEFQYFNFKLLKFIRNWKLEIRNCKISERNFAIFIIILFLIFIHPSYSYAQTNSINLYFFYGDGCPHCAKEEKFLNKLERENKDIKIYRYEVWYNQENAQLFSNLTKELKFNVRGVPFLIIGDKTISGYYNDKTTGEEINQIIKNYTINKCNDIVQPVLNKLQSFVNTNVNTGANSNTCVHNCDQNNIECQHNCGCKTDKIKQTTALETIDIPLFGTIEIKNFSLPVLTIIIAAIDGFNPCAMWILLFLISLLLGMQNRKKMWILGSAFIVASGIVYLLFLSAWLNLFLFLSFIIWIRIIIGLIALASGGYHLREYFVNPGGVCRVTNAAKQQKIFEKIKHIINNQKFYLALIGIILLAAAVSLVELVCSIGLPAVYTNILTMSNLPIWQYYIYILLYVFIFTLDDLIVFVIAMSALQIKAINLKYTRWSNLIGGIIMLIIGILLIFNPGWLMFG